MPLIANIEIGGPFQILARQVWIKAGNRKPPATGEMVVPKAVQAGSSSAGSDATNLINQGGLRDRDSDDLYEHGTDPHDMWLSAKGQTDGWLEFTFEQPQKLGAICLWNYNDMWHTERGVRKASLSAWTRETGWHKILEDVSLNQAEGSDDYDEPTVITLKEVTAQKIRLDRLVGFGDPEYVGLSEVQFFEPLGPTALKPHPSDGAEDISLNDLTLTWTPGAGAAAHNVYLGTEAGHLPLLGRVEAPEARLSKLAGQTTYYWRIDEIQPNGSTIKSNTWSFATGGLVLWWKLDESAGNRAADSSGHDHAGTVTGGALWRPAAGRLGGALEFDGLDDKVEDLLAGEYLNGLGSMTISLWVKSHVTDEDRDILSTRDPSGDDNRIGLRYDKDGAYGGARQCIKAALCTSLRDTHIESSANVQTTTWQHLVLVWESRSTPRLYIDGVRDPLTSGGAPVPGLTAGVEKLVLGRGAKDKYWKGLIDDLRIYSCALTDDEIKALAAGEAPASSPTKVTLKSP